MKKLLFIINICLCFGNETPLIFFPQVSSNYFSSGSINHMSQSGLSTITTLGLGAKKSEGNLLVSGLFQFSSAQNLNKRSVYFNPDLNIEMHRKYIDSDISWFESSDLKIEYSKDSFSIFFGKFNTIWGSGKSSLFLSNNIPSFPHMGFTWDLTSELTLDYLVGSLTSNIIDSTKSALYKNIGSRNNYYTRSIVAHRLVWKPIESISFKAMESVIFGNRGIDIHYLLPFVPFWSMQHYTGDLDNVQMCGEINWILNENWKVFGSLFIDEWRPEWTFNKNNRNWFGWQIGGIGNSIFTANDRLRFEHTWTDHRIYRHRFRINDSYSFQYSLGFWAGPHAQESYLSYLLPIKGYNIYSYISKVKRGELTDQMLEGQYQNIYYDRFSNTLESRFVASIVCTKGFLNDKILLKIGGEWIDWKNAGFDPLQSTISGKDVSKFSILISVKAITPISFN